MFGTRHEEIHGELIERRAHGYALSIIAAGVVIALLYWGRIVFITTIVAVIIALILEPFVAALIRLHVPRSIASFIVCVFAIMVLYLVGLGCYNQLSGLAGEVPAFQQHLSAFIGGASDEMQRMEDSAAHFLTPAGKAPLPPPVAPPPRPASRRGRKTPPPETPPAVPGTIQEVRIHQDRNPIANFIYAQLGTLYTLLLMASFVPFLVYFMLSWRDHIYRSFLRFFDGADRVTAARSLEGVSRMARAFVAGNFLIGALLAACSWGAFALLRIPYPFLAGFLSGFLSLIPYVGGAAALLPPLVAAIAGGVSSSAIVIIFLVVLGLHLAAMNLLYPLLVGARVHLNPLVVTISLMFWGFLWDAAGLLLAIPITAGIKAVCDNVEGLKPYGRFLGN